MKVTRGKLEDFVVVNWAWRGTAHGLSQEHPDPWWNPAAGNQAIDRAHRIGQTSNVMEYRMVSEGTIEEEVLQLQKKKAELFDALTTGSSTAASGLSVDDVRELFSLD